MVKFQFSKLATRVRSPLPALFEKPPKTTHDMKSNTLISTLTVALLSGLVPATAANTKTKCTEVVAHLESEIAKEPARVLLSVEDALNANDTCSCAIIKAAIATSHADSKLVGEIVSTAINTIPTSASTIGECALAAAPDAAADIKTAMQTVLGQGDGAGKAPVASAESAGKEPISRSGKEPISMGKTPIAMGKEPITIPPAKVDDTDLAMRPVDIQGIYFSTPSAQNKIVEKTITKVIEITKKVYVPVPATKS